MQDENTGTVLVTQVSMYKLRNLEHVWGKGKKKCNSILVWRKGYYNPNFTPSTPSSFIPSLIVFVSHL